jgi:4-diphosphocytidyl-2-C-methyl-D-erythritol kinase
VQCAVPRAGPCVTVRVPAKVNLFLSILGRRSDGYHELVTVLQSVTLFDRMRFTITGPPGQGQHPAARRRMRVCLTHDGGPDVPTDKDNLAIRAAWALGHVTKVLDLALVEEASHAGEFSRAPVTVIELQKRIPVGGGLAGGSADAAAALVGLNELWGCYLSRDSLKAIGSTLGSDVPFCCVGGTAIGTGRGTRLSRAICRGVYWWVICQAHAPLSTAAVYQAWDRECTPTEKNPRLVLAALAAHDPKALGASLSNDLEPAAFSLRPELAEAKTLLVDEGALGAVLSGSGPTLLALCESQQAARALARAVAGHFQAVEVACSPAGGPEAILC